MNPSAPQPAPSHVGLLRCATCGNSLPCTRSDMLRFTKVGWPKCCAGVMALILSADKSAGDTALGPSLGNDPTGEAPPAK